MPLLSDRCFQCHGYDQQKSGLRLDEREVALEVGAIVPNHPEASELIARVFATDPEERMPPAESKLSLTDEDKHLRKRWIAQGATY